jgi:ABC-type lipoprotein export system ATPase subunit
VSPEPLIQVDDVPVVARGKARGSVERVAFTVAPGEAVVIVGPNGSGKTSLLQYLAGVGSPSEGCVKVAGQDLATFGYDEMRRHRTRVGYVFESGGFLSNRSVLDNIALPLTYHGRWSMALATVHMKARGLATELGIADGLDLVGMQADPRVQRAALFARALIIEPEILLVDAPKNALTPRGCARVAAAIERRRKQRKMAVVYADQDAGISPFVAERQITIFRAQLSSHPPAVDGTADEAPPSLVRPPMGDPSQ